MLTSAGREARRDTEVALQVEALADRLVRDATQGRDREAICDFGT